ncbi:hypothetical protein [Streptomyces minutiscleroticus]|uniref:Secreted protein n=1 Tax=Streptomyces minutiscleroticus TaxID=68238 RepID=A0A918U774_9ACTN|nr:hypothetical protein [Streptomyces minutiscleroticus]GGY06088.1 hypothetical protein GCM10010358_69350 [Streptomyces minutiscleroticus]
MTSKTRTALTAGVLSVALGLGATVQASAGTPRSVSGKPSDDITRIADFYGAYIDAVTDGDSGDLEQALRGHYLTAGFQEELNAWEERNHANGVLRAQNVPLAWKVTDNGATDHTRAVITLTWGGSSTTQLVVDMARDSRRIFRIEEKGIGGK